MAENEEDYLDGLLKSLSEDENAQSENKDEEEEQIKEQVREAFEKSNMMMRMEILMTII
mgnify:CR=1 FL=1